MVTVSSGGGGVVEEWGMGWKGDRKCKHIAMASNLTGIVLLRGNEKVYLPFELFFLTKKNRFSERKVKYKCLMYYVNVD